MLRTKADPNAALNESQPIAAQLEASTLSSLKDMTFYDRTGTEITKAEADSSNPSRRRNERPLDTVRGFILDIERGWEGRRGTSVSGRSSHYAPRPSSGAPLAQHYGPGPRRSAGAYSPRAPPPMAEEPEQMHPPPHGGDWNFNNKVGAMLAYADGEGNENVDGRMGQPAQGGYPLRDRVGQQRVEPGYGGGDYGAVYGPPSGYGEADYQAGYRTQGYAPAPGYGDLPHDQGHPGRPAAAAAVGGPYGYGDGRG